MKKSIYDPVAYIQIRLDELSCKRIVVNPDMLETIKEQLKGQYPSVKKIRHILRTCGYQQCYLQIPTILNTLRPKSFPALTLSSSENRKIIWYFKKYIETWHSLKDTKRKNALHNHYVLSKIFQMIDRNEFIHYLYLPKGKRTIKNHNIFWKEICKLNKWKYLE